MLLNKGSVVLVAATLAAGYINPAQAVQCFGTASPCGKVVYADQGYLGYISQVPLSMTTLAVSVCGNHGGIVTPAYYNSYGAVYGSYYVPTPDESQEQVEGVSICYWKYTASCVDGSTISFEASTKTDVPTGP